MNLNTAEAERFRERYLTSDNQKIRDGIVFLAQLCGVSCWTGNKDEDLLMWNFAGSKNGVAIRSSCEKVLQSLTCAHQFKAEPRPGVCAVG
jgi:hypothetical protein